MNPAWYPHEVALAGPEHLDVNYVQHYGEKYRFDFTPDVEQLLDCGLNETSTVVDIGCGIGRFALAAARHSRRVVAVDVSPAMIAAVRANVDRAGADNIEPVLAGFLSYDHIGEPPDVVHTSNALHSLPDLWKAVALARMAALLRPGGILLLRDLIFSFNPGEIYEHVEAWLENSVDDPRQGWTRQEHETHLREEYSTFSWLLEPMLQRAGFDLLEVAHDPSRIYSRYLCIRPE